MPIGYADGLRRGLSGRTDVRAWPASRFHQVGNICMDQCMFEVNLRIYGAKRRIDPQIGDDGDHCGSARATASVTIDQMAETLGTIQHEVAIGFGCSRMPRVYV